MLKPGTPSANVRELMMGLLVGLDDGGATFDDGTHWDWSVKLRDENGFEIGRSFDIFDGSNTAQMDMPWERIERLQRALTLLLMNQSVADDRATAELFARNEHFDREQKALAVASAA